ncbi:MAG: hypothetical protein Q9227_002038 [Pyrenula ochraceoflavens]
MAGTHRYKFDTAPVASPKAIIRGQNYRFTVLTDGLLRYEWAKDNVFEDRASTFAINRKQPVPDFNVTDEDDKLEVVTKSFRLIYDKKPFSPSGFTVQALSGFSSAWGSKWRYGQNPGDLGGTARTLDGADGKIPLGPAVISRNGLAVIDDSKSMLFDEDGWIAGRREGERDDGYIFAYGHDFKGAIKALYSLSGHQPRLPRWSLGNWWSRYHAYSDKEYLDLMDKFKSKDIPLSVAVLDMDWHWVDEKWVRKAGVSGWTGYSWNKKLFPNPRRFTAELHSRGLKITMNDHPADGVQTYEDSYKEMAAALGHRIKHRSPIEFEITDKQFCDAFFDILHRKLENDGADFWWVDWQQGPYSRVPGIDPLWMLNHFHFLDNKFKNGDAPLIFSRYAGPGSHRYPVGFSGDTVVSWASLDFQPEFTATASNIGYGWWSHDIGGHMLGGRDEELTVRWVQLGVFSPIMRLHSTQSAWMSKEPWAFGVEAESVMTEILRFRHKLIPYLHTVNVQDDHLPLVRPMYWDYPDHDAAYHCKNQFSFGPSLLVAAVTSPRNAKTGLAKVKAWLPPHQDEGFFVDIFTNLRYNPSPFGRELHFYRPLNAYPVLLPPGAILPLDPRRLLGDSLETKGLPNDCSPPLHLDLLVNLPSNTNQDFTTSLIEDPPLQHVHPTASTTLFTPQPLTLIIESPNDEHPLTAMSAPTHLRRSYTIHFLGIPFTKGMEATIECFLDELAIYQGLKSTTLPLYNEAAFSIGPECPTLRIVDLPSGLRKVQVKLEQRGQEKKGWWQEPSPEPEDSRAEIAQQILQDRVFKLLFNMQIEYAVKDRIWDIVKSEGVGQAMKASQLLALGVDEEVVGPVLEILLAEGEIKG